MTTFRAMVWFARTSWAYLGCDQGTGRWSARRRYLAGLVPAARRFATARRADSRDGQQRPHQPSNARNARACRWEGR